jgi:hypothetical protein
VPSRRLHKKVWIAWGRWWAVQGVWMLELSFGFRIEPRRPLLDLFLGPLTIAVGNHPVLTDPRMNQHHGGRGFVNADPPSQQRDLGTVYAARIL